jgi:hypothetical protein
VSNVAGPPEEGSSELADGVKDLGSSYSLRIFEADGVKDLGFLLYPENIWG